ncbi:unnamed protein product [Didymodactylos carnosus]|uniref:Uncharacterized protein n=1 Tax=Didymodactylos carnosus TaxID=1234261 RepID=A0A814MUU0_9BILA|nr:unnamed protein product [Didymodactylos carnosus]CAF3849377.1 unnamed protein product [Didymodactylos carnosus]
MERPSNLLPGPENFFGPDAHLYKTMSIKNLLLLINSTNYPPSTSSISYRILSSLFNKTTSVIHGDISYYADSFPLPYDDIIDDDKSIYIDDQQQSLISSNFTNIYYPNDDILIINNTNLSSLYDNYIDSSLTSSISFGPFIYIFIILSIYILLTILLLAFSIYKQRQNDEYYFDTIEKENNCLHLKCSLIKNISKGDMEPLLNDYSIITHDNNDTTIDLTSRFPLRIV